MASCRNCGAPVWSAYCSKCGSAASAGGSALPENAAAALSYLFFFISGLLMLIWSPYSRSRTVRFHAIQSILMSIGWLMLNAIAGLLLPSIFGLRRQMMNLMQLGGMLLWLFVMYKAYVGHKVVLPVIGPIAENQS
jgi:uncharacterized membrane protein